MCSHAQAAVSDLNGDGTTDVSVDRPSTGTWYIRDQFIVNHGLAWDIPIPGDFNGVAVTDIAINRSASSSWAVKIDSL
jgi:hypothetical protein